METLAPKFELRIYRDLQQIFQTIVDKPIEVGRQRIHEGAPVVRTPGETCDRIIVTSLTDTRISRSQLLVEPTGQDALKLRNLSDNRILHMSNNVSLNPGEHCEVQDIDIRLDSILVRICNQEAGYSDCFTLDTPLGIVESNSMFQKNTNEPALVHTLGSDFDIQQQATLLQWLQWATVAFREPASSKHFLTTVIAALIRIIDFDFVSVHSYTNHKWQNLESTDESPCRRPLWHEEEIGTCLVNQQRTVIKNPKDSSIASMGSSDRMIAQLACPLLDKDNKIVGAVYAERSSGQSPVISQFEASVAELVASAITAGWQRLQL